MTIIAIKHNLLTDSNLEAYYTEALWRSRAQSLRNQMRTALNYSGSPWIVSDIAQYSPTASDYRGFVWLVRHSSGPEWLFGLGAFLNSTSIWAFNSFFPAIFRFIHSNVAPGTHLSLAHLVMHYNNDFAVGSYLMNFTNTTNLTYSGGDFQVLTSPNWPFATGFYPAGTMDGTNLYPVAPFATTDSRRYRTATAFAFEDTGPSISVAHIGPNNTGVPTAFCAVGEIIDPSDPLDTGAKRRSGAFGCTITSNFGNTQNSSQLVTSARWARFFDAAGVVQNSSSWTATGDKTWVNDRIFPGGIFTGRPIPVDGGSKGVLDPKFFLEAGAANDYARYAALMRTADNDLLIKVNGLCTMPWQSGVNFLDW